MKISVALTICIFIAGCNFQHPKQSAVSTISIERHMATIPAPRSDKWWIDRHNDIIERLKQGNVDLLFIGDSITRNWESTGKLTWDKYYAPRMAVNLGFGGDQTQNVLWRLENGEITGISPKLAIIMIGTNSAGLNANETADGIIAIVQKLRADLPNTKVLFLAIFPRGEKPCQEREQNAQASIMASRIADNKMIFYKDIGSTFLDENDVLIKKYFTDDFVHLSEKGYEAEAHILEPLILSITK